MPTPFKVKAIYDYKSEEPDDLIFDNGQIITVTEEDDEDWYTGDYVNAKGERVEGIFPRNFVEKYEPVVPSRPARAPRRSVQPDPTEQEQSPEPLPTSPPLRQQSFSATDPEPTAQRADQVSTLRQRDPVEELEPVTTSQPARTEVKPPKQPPPVAEKPTSSSFKDRIAAFNKPAAAPVAPFKPGGASNTGFIKKAFVAPPPSRNAYVPPPREPPPQKVYRREEDPSYEAEENAAEKSISPPMAPMNVAAGDQDDEPKPTSLKERIALLQKQQMEQAARHSEAGKKKEKPKRPSKPRTESTDLVEDSTEAPITKADTGETIGRASIDRGRSETGDMNEPQMSPTKGTAAVTPPLPSRELVSDTNDADDSGAGDTEDAQETSTEEERPKPRAAKSIEHVEAAEVRTAPVATKAEGSDEEAEEDNGNDEEEEEEEDPEVRRRRELRERMAKMSGGMGMMGMLGGGMPPPPSKPRAPKMEKPLPETSYEEETARAPPVPIMALPGMSNIRTKPVEEAESDTDQEDSALPTPQGPGARKQMEDGDDYVSHQQLSRRSTEKSRSISQDRAPPPPPPGSRPEQATSPGVRPVPPPPPPTREETQVPLQTQVGGHDEEDDEDDDDESTPAPAMPPRAVPPLPPGRPKSPPATDLPRGAPPVPMSPTSPQTRAPPPPPPAQPPSRRSTLEPQTKIRAKEDSDEEVTEYDGDYDTDIASSAKHKDALKSHNRDSSFDEGILTDDAAKSPTSPPTRIVPPLPPSVPPRDVPPPPPSQAPPKSRRSEDAPRAAPPPVPPPVPPPKAPLDDEEEYDPYRYTAPQHGLTGTAATVRSPTEEIEEDDMYGAAAPSRAPPPPMDRQAPPPPPSERPAPPLPPVERVIPSAAEQMTMSGGLAAPEPRSKQSLEIGRTPTVSRKSAEGVRQSLDQSFIASDVDVAPYSMWWNTDNTPPPTLQNRPDILWEVESSTSQKRGGKTTISRDVYVLYQDYSQTTINVTFDQAEPNYATFEQNHERPPIPPRKDQLEAASENFGSQIAKGADRNSGNTIGDGGAHEFILALMQPLASALLPVGTRSYGAIVYANMANASTQQNDEIRAGDIITFKNAKFAGHKGGLHQKYQMDVGKPEHVGIVIDWDGTKKKIRVWEQGREEKGKKSKVREESYRISDLKSGEVRVWRVMPRSYVNWGSS